jgi:hypothetical protein
VSRGKYYIDKRCTNMGGSKNGFIVYQNTKVHKLGNPKNDKVKKP